MEKGHGRRQPSEREKRFGEGLKKARRRRSIIDQELGRHKPVSQEDLGERIDRVMGEWREGASGATVASWEQGRRVPGRDSLLALRQVLDGLDPLNDEERELFAQMLRASGAGERRLCAVMVPPLRSTFWSSTVAELVAECATSNPPLHVMLYAHDEDPQAMLRDLIRLREHIDELAGVVIAAASPGTDKHLAAEIASALGALHGKDTIPIVQIDRFVEFADGRPAPYHFAGLADAESTAMVVRELIAAGHHPDQIIGVFDVLTQVTQVRRRLGFINALMDANLNQEAAEALALAYSSPAVMQRQSNEHDWRAIGTLVEEVLRRSQKKRPTAIVAATSYIAREVQRVMQTLDLERAIAAPQLGAGAAARPLIDQIRIVSLDGASRPEFVREVNFLPYTPRWLAMMALKLLRGPHHTTPQVIYHQKEIIRRTPLAPFPSTQEDTIAMESEGKTPAALSSVKVACRGRVCMIGEFLDAELGSVLAATIEREIVATATSRHQSNLGMARVYGPGVRMLDEQGEWRYTLDYRMDFTLGSDPKSDAERYVDAVIRNLREAAIIPSDWRFDLKIESDLPAQRGLGSSGALTVAIGLALATLRHVEQRRVPEQDGMIPRLELAKCCKEAEVSINNVLCGWMDQVTPLFSTAGHALWIDTDRGRTPMTRNIAFPDDWCFALLDADQTRELAAIGGKYNHLQREFVGALSWLHKRQELLDFVVPSRLFDLDEVQLRDARAKGMPEHYSRIAEHALTERLRLERAVDVLHAMVLEGRSEERATYLNTLADQMAASHRSLATRCRVSTPGLQYLVAVAGRAAKSLGLRPGAKLVGAGYGGVVTCVIPTSLQAKFRDEVKKCDQAVRRRHPDAFQSWHSLHPIRVDFSVPTDGYTMTYHKEIALDKQ